MKYTLVFTAEQERRLEKLAAELQVSKAEAVRQAIALLSKIVCETASDGKAVRITKAHRSAEGGVLGKRTSMQRSSSTK